jgi:uncharacterized PurR-regulated membrane protein YhhQ (DUF165 family)
MRFWPLVAYIATIFAANWAVVTFGPVPVGFGLMAPAGVYFAGLAFTLRDLTQDELGRRWTYAAILIGAGISGVLSGPLAIASAVAFLVSETADLLVYTPLRERRWLAAVAASNLIGLAIDSVLFLWLAFGSLQFLAGQIVGKLAMTVLAVLVLWGWRALLSRKPHAGVAAAD